MRSQSADRASGVGIVVVRLGRLAVVGLSVGEYECTLGVLRWAGGEGWFAVECGGGKVEELEGVTLLLKAQMNYYLRLLLGWGATLSSLVLYLLCYLRLLSISISSLSISLAFYMCVIATPSWLSPCCGRRVCSRG